MKKRKLSILALIALICANQQVSAQTIPTPAEPEYYAMNSQQMAFDDYQTLLINYRGFVSPRQYSVTQFTNVNFLPIQSEFYHFNLNFHDKATGRIIEDDVPIKWKSWIDDRGSYDPLGSNFRPNSPSSIMYSAF